MLTLKSRRSSLAAVVLLLAPWVLLPLTGCENDAGSGIDLAPFQALARTADCSDLRNRLFLIDADLVFWDRAGSCADALYSLNFYAGRVDAIVCYRADSIGGGNVTICPDDRYRDMFETMRSHLDDPQLGLGSGHTVQPIAF